MQFNQTEIVCHRSASAHVRQSVSWRMTLAGTAGPWLFIGVAYMMGIALVHGGMHEGFFNHFRGP
jgi:hypothetical protein